MRNDKAMPKAKSKSDKGCDKSKQQFRLCVPPCPRYITGGDTHSLCVVCLGAKHTQSALEGADCPHCERLSLRTLRSRRALFEEGALASVPRGYGPIAVVGFAGGSRGGNGDGRIPFAGSSTSSQVSEARSDGAVSSAHGERSALRLSSSEEGDGESTDEPPQSAQYEELVEVITRAVAKLHLEWPAEKQAEPSKSKLDERFLRSKPLPPRRGLSFFPDLHSEVSRSWGRPYSARLFSPSLVDYSNVSGLNYRAMPRVEQRLASYLSPAVASSLKAPALPTKPLRTTSALVGKGYTAAGQAGACLHTMAVLQAYQADLLKELDEGEKVKSEDIQEL